MKYLSIIAFVLFQMSNCIGQIKISTKIIPWKTLDKLDSLMVVLQTTDREILKSAYFVGGFKHIDGEYPRTIFEVDFDKLTSEIEFKVGCKYKAGVRGDSDQFSHFETLSIPINNREERIELEIHFQKYYYEEFDISSKERIDRLVAKKIYKLPEGIQLIRNWQPAISSHPKYFIQNDTEFKLYGVSADGRFEGELFKTTNDTVKQVYTGGYNLSNEPSKQLYKNNYVLSSIRDHREADNEYKICQDGSYLYRVYLAFYPYDENNRFGKTPYFSVRNSDCSTGSGKHKIYEYFELKDKFEIE